MTKGDLAAELANTTGLSLKKADEVIDALFSAKPGKGIIATALDDKRRVTITGFGTFTVRRRASRMGRNPATGQSMTVPAKWLVRFKAGSPLAKSVNE